MNAARTKKSALTVQFLLRRRIWAKLFTPADPILSDFLREICGPGRERSQAQQGSRESIAPGSSGEAVAEAALVHRVSYDMDMPLSSCRSKGDGAPRKKNLAQALLGSSCSEVGQVTQVFGNEKTTISAWAGTSSPSAVLDACTCTSSAGALAVASPVLRLLVFFDQDLNDKSTNERVMLAAQTAIFPCENISGVFPQTLKSLGDGTQPPSWSIQSHPRAPHPLAFDSFDSIYKPTGSVPSYSESFQRYQALMLQITRLDAARGTPTRRTEDSVPLSCRAARAHWPGRPSNTSTEHGRASQTCSVYEPHEASVPTSHRMITYHIPLRLPLQARTPPQPLLLVTWTNGTRGSKRNNLITQLSARRHIPPNEGIGTCDRNRQRHEVKSPGKRFHVQSKTISSEHRPTRELRRYYTCYNQIYLYEEKLPASQPPRFRSLGVDTCVTIDGRIRAKIQPPTTRPFVYASGRPLLQGTTMMDDRATKKGSHSAMGNGCATRMSICFCVYKALVRELQED
ncbi:hypothetical protein BBK36DRAFT_1139140 [Trichoderma citrinoviride]|uniref:Uncharacterized protein n=1 Tax=Trichoderma citrinoviride TaxID=58853 RepID=A0A2T4BIC1_9HYPO|nr:hypothetical protein BBK36DRAFT_1139140 [Trichoderma citrinoviride]PTB69055.1 hypothetical protein BBK36DRAFT_1139140 [Trichoderma citrinoviride]